LLLQEVLMNTFDFAPLFRTAIGFDRLASMMDAVSGGSDLSYPPYNIEKTGDDSYCLTMAVAGFGPGDIELTVKDNTLLVAGRAGGNEKRKAEVLYRGIAGRGFERRFVLADHIVVDGAELQNGMLSVNLKHVVPEALKPRKIPVTSGAPKPASEPAQVGNDAAAPSRAA
jgi:molecular chaperone IbpA